MEDMIGDSAHDISIAFLRDIPASNQDEKEDMIRFDLEVCLFCEQIYKEMKKLLTTELEEGHQATMPLVSELETDSDEGQAAMELDTEEKEFAAYRRSWQREWGDDRNSFENLSSFSPMMFTHCSSVGAVVGRTFQVYSVKIVEIKGIQWPLKVYGMVAARDDVDKHRNPLFFRSRDNYQIVHQKDHFLQLTGPCRAIVSKEPVEIEVRLRVNRGNNSDDRPLISDVYYYNTDYAHLLGSSDVIENHLYKIELSYQQLDQSVQATFLGFDVGEPSPFEHGVRVVCSPVSQGSIEDVAEHKQVVLFDSRYERMPMGKCAYLNLSRHVVSLELQGKREFSYRLMHHLVALLQMVVSSSDPKNATPVNIHVTLVALRVLVTGWNPDNPREIGL
ncbi:hypothetical protein ACQ4PT_060007 [Festuca glaucescens]